MNEEILGLLGVSPEQMQQYQQRQSLAGLQALGTALMQAGAPRQGGRVSTLAGFGQAAPAFAQGRAQEMDNILKSLLQRRQVEQMAAEQQARQQQAAARTRLVGGLQPQQQDIATAFPETAQGMIAPAPQVFKPGEILRSPTGEILFQAPEASTPDFKDYQKAVQQGYGGSFLDYQTAMAQARRSQVTATATAGGGKDLSPGEKKRDEKAAEDIYQWESGGGQDMTAQIAQLKPVIADLEAGKPVTGVSVAVQPDLLLAMTNPRALQNREVVEEVVQRNLRVILGAQFTEKEGERLISRAFNPKLPPQENAKRIRKLFLQMETAAQQKQAMADYFNQNGTLKGYQGKMPTVADFERAMEGTTAPASGSRRFNPATGRVE